jgi:UrcA family protein
MKTFTALASTVVLSMIAVNASYAGELPDAPRSLTVQFADLDLSKPEGAAHLFGRMRGAAKKVCAPLGGTSLREKYQYADCIELALSNAIARVDRPMLTKYAASDRSSKKATAPMQVASGH